MGTLDVDLTMPELLIGVFLGQKRGWTGFRRQSSTYVIGPGVQPQMAALASFHSVHIFRKCNETGLAGMPGGGHNEAKFKQAIFNLSNSNNWDEAKAEWELFFVYVDPSDRSCECEHSPIHQICIIKNRKNANKTEVGNVCVRRFLRLMSNRIFSVIRRVSNDRTKSLNPKALELFRQRGVISVAEEQEYTEYWRKRVNVSKDQLKQKADINDRVLSYVHTETAKLIAAAQAHGIKV